VTQKCCCEQKVVICAQDTTEFDFTRPKQQVQDAGSLDVSKRRGAFLHLNEAFTEDGTPLGAVSAEIWARDEPDESTEGLSDKERKAVKAKKLRETPFEDRESYRWLEGVRAVQELAVNCPNTTCISVSDSESDIYNLLAEPRSQNNFHFIGCSFVFGEFFCFKLFV
jgi:hypothetical protein